MTEEIKLSALEEFVDRNFSHNGAEEFLGTIGEQMENYHPIHLSVAYAIEADNDKRLRGTEIKLARKAIEKGCSYVTNIDYCEPCIAATGLKRIV